MNRIKAIILISLTLLFLGCKTSIKNPIQSVFNKPEVASEGFEITSLSFDSIEGLLIIKVNNTNSISIEYPQVAWSFKMGEIIYQSGELPKGNKIAPSTATEIQIPITVPFEKLYDEHPALQRVDVVPYTFVADFNFKLPFFGKSSNSIVATGELPLLKMPVLNLESILLSSMEPEQVDFAVTASVHNKNGFDINIDRVNYTLVINNTQWATGNTRRQILAKPAQKSNIPLNISLRTSSMVSEAYGLVLSEQDVRFDFRGTLICHTTSPYLEDFELPFHLIGTKRIKL